MQRLISYWVVACLIFLLSTDYGYAQKKISQYFNGTYQVYSLREKGLQFRVFDFDMSGNSYRVQYFGKNGGQRMKYWKGQARNQVLCYFAVGFSQDFEKENPIGLCVDNGRALNQTSDDEMDGLVSIDRNGELMAIDLDHELLDKKYNVKKVSDVALFLRGTARSNISVFQTQLMYSESGKRKMGELRYGKRAPRRFLAICTTSNNQTHHLMMDLAESVPLNLAADRAITTLQNKGYRIQYLLNLDTGARNIMAAFDGRGEAISSAPVDLEKAAQLIVYYRK